MTSQPPQTPSDPTDWIHPHEEQEGLGRYVETLRERAWVVAAVALLTLAVAIVYLLIAARTYEATAEVMVTPVSTDPGSPLVGLPLIQQSVDPTRDVATASLLIANADVAERVVEQLRLDVRPRELLEDVEAQPVAQSSLVNVKASASTPEAARDLANAFAEEALAERTERLHDVVDDVIDALETGTRRGSDTSRFRADLAALQRLQHQDDPTLQLATPATAPTRPATPRVRLTIVGALIGGGALGVVLAFALQALDPLLRREEQLRRLFKLPILGRIPRDRRRQAAPLDPLRIEPTTAEAYRTLKGTLMVRAQNAGSRSRAVLVTGSSASEGKTTTAINLATSLAAGGSSVVLIEADLRRPSIGRAFGVKPPRGLAAVLIESATLADATVTVHALGPRLKLLLADYEGGWISDLFSLPAARELIEDARAAAEYVIIDSPPLTDVVDALPLAGYVDDILLVVRPGTTEIRKLVQLGDLLADNALKPAGLVVIGTQRPSRSAYDYVMRGVHAEDAPAGTAPPRA